MTGDLVFQNLPSDLKHMAFSYSAPPGVDNLLVRHWMSDGPHGGAAFTVYDASLLNSITGPFVRDEYFMPIPYPDFSYGYTFEEVYPFDATGDIAWDAQVARTPYLAALDTTTMEGFLLGEAETPVLTTDSSQMAVGLAPPSWFGEFDNTSTAIQLRAPIGNPVWLFLDQMQGMTPHPDLAYELYQGGILVKTGDLQGVGNPWGGSSLVSIPAASGNYTLKVSFDKYYVASTGGLAIASASFDTSAADKDPPTLVALNVLSSGGEPTDTIPPTASGQVRLEFTGDLPLQVTLRYSTGDGSELSLTWHALTVTDLGAGDYRATLLILPNNSVVSLSVYAEDASGNSLHYRMLPAFEVALEAPALRSPANGFATSQRGITFEWGAVETAVAYRIQIDRVDTFDSPNLAETITTGTRHTATLAKGVHYWRILARDSQLNESPWSQLRRLTIADPVLQVTTHTGDDYEPAIMEATDGILWVTWYACPPYPCGIWIKTSDDSGATWAGKTQLTSSNYYNYAPSIAQTTGGRIWVAWYSWRPGLGGTWNYDIWYRYSVDNGANWSAETQLTTDTGTDYVPSIAEGPGGEIWVVWSSYRSGNYDLWYRTGDGTNWSPALQLTTDPGGDYSPAITRTTDGKMRVVWNRYSEVYYVTTPDGGATWSPETSLVGRCNNYDPTIAQTTGGGGGGYRIWVAWYSWRNLNPAGVWNWDVLYKYSDDNGATWSQEVPFTRFLGTDYAPGIAALRSGYLAVSWTSLRSGNYDIWYGVVGVLEDVNPPPVVQSATHRPFPNPDSDDVVTFTARVIDEKGIEGSPACS